MDIKHRLLMQLISNKRENAWIQMNNAYSKDTRRYYKGNWHAWTEIEDMLTAYFEEEE